MQFIDRLRDSPKCSLFLAEFLNTIQHRMLIVEPKFAAGRERRISCGNLFRGLGEMNLKGEKARNAVDPVISQES